MYKLLYIYFTFSSQDNYLVVVASQQKAIQLCEPKIRGAKIDMIHPHMDMNLTLHLKLVGWEIVKYFSLP